MLDISFQVAKILTLAFGAFALAMILTPWWTNILYKYRLGKQIRTEGAPILPLCIKIRGYTHNGWCNYLANNTYFNCWIGDLKSNAK